MKRALAGGVESPWFTGANISPLTGVHTDYIQRKVPAAEAGTHFPEAANTPVHAAENFLLGRGNGGLRHRYNIDEDKMSCEGYSAAHMRGRRTTTTIHESVDHKESKGGGYDSDQGTLHQLYSSLHAPRTPAACRVAWVGGEYSDLKRKEKLENKRKRLTCHPGSPVRSMCPCHAQVIQPAETVSLSPTLSSSILSLAQLLPKRLVCVSVHETTPPRHLSRQQAVSPCLNPRLPLLRSVSPLTAIR